MINQYWAQAGVLILVVSTSAAPARNMEWVDHAGYHIVPGVSQSIYASGSELDASRNLGIYIPHMVYPAGRDAVMSSGFGHREAPCATCSTEHKGIDFNPGYGSPVYSATDGVVTWVGDAGGSLGYNVVIQDPGTWEIFYGHMIENSAPADIVVGSKVKVGQQIGLVGNTGQSTGAHLHFEIHDNGVAVDPLPLLQKYAN